MSWSFTVPPTPADSFGAAAEAALALAIEQNPGSMGVVETAEQARAAVDLSILLVATKAVGSGLVQASLNGHANPEHKPTKGFSPDTITVTVLNADKA